MHHCEKLKKKSNYILRYHYKRIQLRQNKRLLIYIVFANVVRLNVTLCEMLKLKITDDKMFRKSNFYFFIFYLQIYHLTITE